MWTQRTNKEGGIMQILHAHHDTVKVRKIKINKKYQSVCVHLNIYIELAFGPEYQSNAYA